ncbi:ArsC/Spx/MgsR family protein [Flavobacterium sp.]|uniref:ArsC/Spx/MgsR family protein n=1 Tax=Flavobacterium sp. TaxID=239 RepID=UPI003340F98F
MITIYHNPRCGKSRDCVRYFEAENSKIKVVHYLQSPLDREAIINFFQQLNCNALQLVRTKEPIWIAKHKGKKLSENEIIDTLVQHPILMESPVVVKSNKAVIACLLERIIELF